MLLVVFTIHIVDSHFLIAVAATQGASMRVAFRLDGIQVRKSESGFYEPRISLLRTLKMLF